ncbi:hypothetical protein [Nostoc sp. PA-18-2419]|uniref:hypothetical protein n=1 Tax=Nostoc sp. PA-18-2419 TaxID=2575443 RepID=UPI0011080521|nr:hypothetical protein [Nostoc sp. PA-18-2419]
MASNIISFRLNDAEIEALSALQVPEDKSLSQTAARLVRSSFSTSMPLSTKASTGVDILELVKQEVSKAIANSEQLKDLIAANTAYLATGINEIKQEVDERLGELSA